MRRRRPANTGKTGPSTPPASRTSRSAVEIRMLRRISRLREDDDRTGVARESRRSYDVESRPAPGDAWRDVVDEPIRNTHLATALQSNIRHRKLGDRRPGVGLAGLVHRPAQ